MEQIQLVSLIVLYMLIIAIALFANAFYIIGLHSATKEPYILAKAEDWINKKLNSKGKFKFINSIKENLYECMIGCVPCMASFHGILFLTSVFEIFGINKSLLFLILPFYIPALSFVLDMLISIKTLIETKIVENSRGFDNQRNEEKAINPDVISSFFEEKL